VGRIDSGRLRRQRDHPEGHLTPANAAGALRPEAAVMAELPIGIHVHAPRLSSRSPTRTPKDTKADKHDGRQSIRRARRPDDRLLLDQLVVCETQISGGMMIVDDDSLTSASIPSMAPSSVRSTSRTGRSVTRARAM